MNQETYYEKLHYLLSERPERLLPDDIALLREAWDAMDAAMHVWPLISDQGRSSTIDAIVGLSALALPEGIDGEELQDVAELGKRFEYIKSWATADEEASTISVRSCKPRNAMLPMDNVNAKLWVLQSDDGGNVIVGYKHGRAITVSLDVSRMPSGFTKFDYDVYLACGALWYAGNFVVTPNQIAACLGISTNTRSIKQTMDSIDKMMSTIIDVDNSIEAMTYRGKRDVWATNRYRGMLLPCGYTYAKVNGVACDHAIHLYAIPPMIKYAIDTHQVVQIPSLALPVLRTKRNVALNAYLRQRILKNRLSHTALWKTIFKDSGTTDQKHIGELKKIVFQLMDWYKKIGMIYDYRSDDRCIWWYISEREFEDSKIG